MRIGIDASTIGTPGGPRIYVLNLIKSLLEIDKKNEYVIFYNSRKHLGKFNKAKEIAVPFANPFTRLIREWFILPIFFKKEKLDLIHNTKSACSFIRTCKRVVTIHDIIPIEHPETEPLLARIYWKIQIPIAVKLADKIITDSQYSKSSILRKFRIPEKKIEVVYLGVTKKTENSVSFITLPEKYILAVGTTPRKNIDLLLQAYCLIKDRIPHKLVIVGKLDRNCKNLYNLVRKLRLEKNVYFTGFIDDKELSAIYKKASLLVYIPSFEGFGLPVLEAMANGIPVICSNRASLPEIAKGIFVDPKNKKEIGEKIVEVLTDEALRERLIEEGCKKVNFFSWEETAKKTLAIYKSL